VRTRNKRDPPRAEAPDEHARALVPRLADARDPERDIRAELLERVLEHRELRAHELVVADARRAVLLCASVIFLSWHATEEEGDVRKHLLGRAFGWEGPYESDAPSGCVDFGVGIAVSVPADVSVMNMYTTWPRGRPCPPSSVVRFFSIFSNSSCTSSAVHL
jgi:hypothetical protein